MNHESLKKATETLWIVAAGCWGGIALALIAAIAILGLD